MPSVSFSSPSFCSSAFAAEIDTFKEVLFVGGLGAALDFLNTRTAYRFTFIYKSEPPHARRVMVHDREVRYIPSRDLVPVAQTFFELMLTEPVFATPDGLVDERSCLHPGRTHFRGFCGVQLLHADGLHFGWLAHAHPGPLLVPAGEIDFLHLIAPVLMQVLEAVVPDRSLRLSPRSETPAVHAYQAAEILPIMSTGTNAQTLIEAATTQIPNARSRHLHREPVHHASPR